MSTVSRRRDEASAVPVITVTQGEPTPAELAAVLAVLLATRSTAPAQSPRASPWTARSRARGVFPRPGPHAWRASALPY
jgi:hypothetical protein